MPTIKEFHLLNSLSFQEFVADLFNAKENTNTYIVYGKNGQKQNGIDIFSPSTKTIIQCKYREDDNRDKVKQTLKRDIEGNVKNALDSGISFDHFILASTYSHDIELQHFANSLRDEKGYSFSISYIGWEELKKWTLRQPTLLTRYFGSMLQPEIIELVCISVDSNACSWVSKDGYENVFFDIKNERSPFPIFDFTFMNYYSKTVVLKSIRLWVKSLYSGISGPLVSSMTVESLYTYQMKYQYQKENYLYAIPPIQLPSDQAMRFKLQLVQEYNGEIFPITGRNILFFCFDFNLGISVVAPKIYLNTKDDSNKIDLVIMG